MPMTPQEFVAKWRKVTLKEKSASQSHFNDLCYLIGHPTPVEADPNGVWFTFEAGVPKHGGGDGWADVWKKNYFAWEYKGKHKDLDEAYDQLLKYREALLNPPLLVVSDMEQIRIHTNFTNTAKVVTELTYDDLLTPQGLKRLRNIFTDPEAFRAPQTTEQVTQAAAAEFATLADRLRKYGADPQEAAHFLIRLLFCLFAEDIGLLPKDLFTDLARNTRDQPAAFRDQVSQLFKVMATGGWFGANKIRHFDGGLFDDEKVIEVDTEGLEILARVCLLDWSNIEPSILGTLFERSLDPDKRSQIGAHYTSREDILLVVEPVLMAPLRRRWEVVRKRAMEIAGVRDAAAKKATRTKYDKELTALLMGFSDELSAVQVLDPACGSGNFLYVALKQLLDLEKELVTLGFALGQSRLFPTVSPAQVHGIEINEYAHELAQATIWIGYIQWLQDNGFGFPGEPILKPLETVKLMDAILSVDGTGNAKEPEWPEVDVIIGNPPFLGSRKMRPALGRRYCDCLSGVYGGRIEGKPDLVCYWFYKAYWVLHQEKVKRVGLLATQAIRGGTNRKVLDKVKGDCNIFMAWADHDWVLDGANVHVSIIGFDDGSEEEIRLDGNLVSGINSDLTADTDVTTASDLPENSGLCFEGDVLWGRFNITASERLAMLAATGNPNGRPNDDVIRRRITGEDITQRLPVSYVIDFGVDMTLEAASAYEKPFEFIKKHVYPDRAGAADPTAVERWWLHWRPRPEMRNALAPLPRYILTPRVSKQRVFIWVESDSLADSATVGVARADDYFFGVLQSRIHEVWARRQGTQLRERTSGFRYTPKTTFRTFPFPWPPGKEPKDDPLVVAIATAARELVEKRDAWLNPPGLSETESKKRTLTNLYNQRPTWLDLSHRKLDEAVLDAYSWPRNVSDEQVLERLLALNLKRAQEQEG